MTKLEKIHIAQDRTAKIQHGLESVQDNLDKAEKVADVDELDECSGGVVLGIAAAVTLAALAVGVVIIIRKRRNKQEDENEDWPA